MRRNKMSMGCQIDPPTCSICGESVTHPSHNSTSHNSTVYDGKGVQFLDVSFVSGPKCESCDKPMVYLDRGYEWACENAVCPEFKKLVLSTITGLTPSRV